MSSFEWYLDSIKHEVALRESNKFTGSVSFKLNFFKGAISNMMCEMNKSVKRMEGQDAVFNESKG